MLAYADYGALSHTWTLLQAAAYQLMLVRIARAYPPSGFRAIGPPTVVSRRREFDGTSVHMHAQIRTGDRRRRDQRGRNHNDDAGSRTSAEGA